MLQPMLCVDLYVLLQTFVGISCLWPNQLGANFIKCFINNTVRVGIATLLV